MFKAVFNLEFCNRMVPKKQQSNKEKSSVEKV